MTDGAVDNGSDGAVRPYRVLATCASFEPGFRGGGPVRSVARIVDTISKKVDLTLVTRDRDLGSSTSYPDLSGRWVERGRARVFYLDTTAPRQWFALRRDLRKARYDLLYLNSLWHPIYTVAPVVAIRLGLIRAEKILIAPRGEFSPNALALKTRKKSLFLTWWGPFLRRTAVAWHASSPREASDIQKVFPWARIATVPDQTLLPAEPAAVTGGSDQVPRLVFIGRISPMKNLDLSLRALLAVSRPVDFDIFGPMEDRDYWAVCQSLIDQLPPHVRVRYGGELHPSDVQRTFSAYDAFVFPTRGENFGHVIAESLSVCCPVICSDATLWTDVLKAGGGVVLPESTADALAKEIDRVAAMTSAERLDARRAAGHAYRTWREGVEDVNILDHARVTL